MSIFTMAKVHNFTSPFTHIVVSKKLNSSCQSKAQCGSVTGVCPKREEHVIMVIVIKIIFFIMVPISLLCL